jgi:hypothetical protein
LLAVRKYSGNSAMVSSIDQIVIQWITFTPFAAPPLLGTVS